MIEYLKNTNLQELKDNYMDNHGFVILSDGLSSSKGIEKLVNALIDKGITKDLPILAAIIHNATIFVYDQNTNFDAPQFFSYADFFNMIGEDKVIPLRFFLKQNS
jgi:hypothetical protein